MDKKTEKKVNIGCHLSSAAGFEAMGKAALSIEATTFAFFTRNPRGGKAKAIDEKDVFALRKILEDNHFAPLVAHAPYTLNPCSKEKRVRDFARICMEEDMVRMEYLPGNYYNLHPGSHVGQGAEVAIEIIADLLNEVIKPSQSTVILLETMAGKGSEVGRNFKELGAIIDKVKYKDKIGVCMDSCHVSDGGYDIAGSLDEVLHEFDEVIGLDKLKALHINDSLNPLGSHKDRHAAIGKGEIGLKALREMVHHEKLIGLPCILETPQNSLEGYGEEIKILR